MQTLRLVTLSVMVSFLLPWAPARALEVVVSIRPLHSLVAGLMAGAGEPTLLITGSSSPHGHSLRPSEARILQSADLVFWIGPGLESALIKPLAVLTDNATALGDDIDPHLWLDPDWAISTIAVIARHLIGRDPARADLYRRNQRLLGIRLRALERHIRARLEPHSNAPFLVYHDTLGHFVAAYGLASLGSVAMDPERPPGARHVAGLRKILSDQPAACVFIDTEFPGTRARALLGDDIRLGRIDPLGATFAAGPNLYFETVENLATNMLSCLSND